MPFRVPWPQPYPDLKALKSSEVHTLRIDIPKTDQRPILALATSPTIFSLICQHAIKSAAEHIRANNLTYLDADEFVRWVRERSVGSVAPQTAGPVIPGGDTGVRPGTPPSAIVSAESRQNAPSESSGGPGIQHAIFGDDDRPGNRTAKRRPRIKAE